MFDWFRKLTRTEGWIEPSGARRRIQPSRVRVCGPSDFDACIELYQLNEAGRFPAGGLTEFENALRRNLALRFVVEQAGEVRGCGAVHIQAMGQRTIAWLSYGLVHPDWYRKGFGSTLLLARLACLPKEIEYVVLQAVPSSFSFYKGYGFREFRKLNEGSMECSLCCVQICPDDIQYCKSALARGGVEMPAGELAVPVVGEIAARI